MKIIKEKEADLRACYVEPIVLSSDEFVKIILVDAAFIIEVLLRNYSQKRQGDEHDRMLLHVIKPDMMLLENQLPFFILEDLFDPSGDREMLSIIKLSYKFFKSLVTIKGTKKNLEQISSSGVEHFVDLVRKFNVPLAPKSGERKLKNLNIPSTKDLHQAGVQFKVKSSKNLFDIHFSEGILEIPKLTVNDVTELTIRNLLAFEQCHCTENYVSAYVVLRDRLVNTHKDVDLLVKHGIIENLLGDSNQVATLINKLCYGINWNHNDFYFAQISDQICDYRRTPWHKWKANLKQKYCNTPWASLSVIAAVLIIILTIIQAVCSIISLG